MGAIYLLRHGQASFGGDNYDQLSPTGVAQARVLGQALKAREVVPAVALSGTMQRHRDTASGCLAELGATLPVRELAGVNEFDHEAVIRAAEPRYADRLAMMTDFAATGDPRPSVQARFPTPEAYAAAIRAAAPECLIIVDGIQHASHGTVDVRALGIDGYAISPYKVFSRHGYGVGWASDRLTALHRETLAGAPVGTWELGTRDAGSYATFSKVVTYFDWLGGRFTAATDRRARLEAAAKAI